jgi:hypothetical protein
VILNGHEYVACQARKAGIAFTKDGNCFTTISDAAGLAKIAEASQSALPSRQAILCQASGRSSWASVLTLTGWNAVRLLASTKRHKDA